MSVRSVPTTALVIANGQQTSSLLSRDGKIKYAIAVLIGGPSALTGTITVKVQLRGETTYRTLQEGGADVTIAALKVTRVDFPAAFDNIRLDSSGAEGAERSFPITIVEAD